MFQRLHTRDEFEGTGIGLAIARKVVERHGGRIGVVPREQGGTCFEFTLPAVRT
jgi:signal transduction histidine kinase